MSISNAQIYFNRIISDESSVSLQLEQASCIEGQTAEYLAQSMHQSFVKKGQKDYCCFKDGSQVAEKLENEASSALLSNFIMSRICDAIDVTSPPPETILAIACYRHLASDYILATLLAVKDSVQLMENINPEKTTMLDIVNIQLAVQIDVSEIKTNFNSSKSIAYIKGRIGRAVSDFMAEAFEIEPKVNAKDATTKLIETVETFISDSVDDGDKVNTVREVAFDVLKNASDAGDFVEIQDLSDEIEEKTGIAGLYDKAAEDEDFNESCPVYMSASKSLQKIFGQGGGMSISFNRKLLGEHVHFDPLAKSLTFTKLPPNLLDSLEKSKD